MSNLDINTTHLVIVLIALTAVSLIQNIASRKLADYLQE